MIGKYKIYLRLSNIWAFGATLSEKAVEKPTQIGDDANQ